jgi:hypothetical protein
LQFEQVQLQLQLQSEEFEQLPGPLQSPAQFVVQSQLQLQALSVVQGQTQSLSQGLLKVFK